MISSPIRYSSMIYFLPWVVLLSVCILAVPVAAMSDKRKRQQILADQGSEASQESEADADAMEEEALGDVGFGGEAEFGSGDNADAQFEGFN